MRRAGVTLFRGVYRSNSGAAIGKGAQYGRARNLKRGAVQNGDYIVFTIGEPFGKAGGTNTMKIVKLASTSRRSGRDQVSQASTGVPG